MSTDRVPFLLSKCDESDYEDLREDSLSSSTSFSDDSDDDNRSNLSVDLRRCRKLIKLLTSTVKNLDNSHLDSDEGIEETSSEKALSTFGFADEQFRDSQSCGIVKNIAPTNLWSCDDIAWLFCLIITHVIVLSLGVYVGQSFTMGPTADTVDITPQLKRLDESVADIRADVLALSNAVSMTALNAFISSSLNLQNNTSTYTIDGWRLTPKLLLYCGATAFFLLFVLLVLSLAKLVAELCFNTACTIFSTSFVTGDKEAVTVKGRINWESFTWESLSSEVGMLQRAETSLSTPDIRTENVVENGEHYAVHKNEEEADFEFVSRINLVENEDHLSEEYNLSSSEESSFSEEFLIDKRSSEKESTNGKHTGADRQSTPSRPVEVRKLQLTKPMKFSETGLAGLRMHLNAVKIENQSEHAVKISALFESAILNLLIHNDSDVPQLFKLRVTNVVDYTAQPPVGRIDGHSSTTVQLTRKSAATTRSDHLFFEFIELTDGERYTTSEEIMKRFKRNPSPNHEAVLFLSVLPTPNI